jgi:hypothetical protein
MLEDDRIEEIGHDSPVFSVAPVRSRTRVPRAVLLAVTIGIAAFVAGIGVASAGPTPRAPAAIAGPTSSPAGSGTGLNAGLDAERATATPVAPAAVDPGFGAPQPPLGASPDREREAGSSTFLAGFDPGSIIQAAEGGDRCAVGAAQEKEVPRTRRDGPRLTFQRTWMAWCPIATDARQAFLLDVFDGLVAAVPADTFGFSATQAGTGDALLPYGEAPFAGTVTVSAGGAGRGLAVALVVAEWRTDSAP